ncbi:MAG: diacylglycerol kinase [Burkholderiaceae bacterium]|jgi:diacylglycerol kinase (ATP)
MLRKILTRWRLAFAYSVAGLRAAFQHEAAFREEVWLACVLLPLAIWMPTGILEKLWLIGSVLLVMITELLNSALEALTDRVSLETHPLAKRVKDIGSAAVLLALLHAVLVWGAIVYTIVT